MGSSSSKLQDIPPSSNNNSSNGGNSRKGCDSNKNKDKILEKERKKAFEKYGTYYYY